MKQSSIVLALLFGITCQSTTAIKLQTSTIHQIKSHSNDKSNQKDNDELTSAFTLHEALVEKKDQDEQQVDAISYQAQVENAFQEQQASLAKVEASKAEKQLKAEAKKKAIEKANTPETTDEIIDDMDTSVQHLAELSRQAKLEAEKQAEIDEQKEQEKAEEEDKKKAAAKILKEKANEQKSKVDEIRIKEASDQAMGYLELEAKKMGGKHAKKDGKTDPKAAVKVEKSENKVEKKKEVASAQQGMLKSGEVKGIKNKIENKNVQPSTKQDIAGANKQNEVHQQKDEKAQKTAPATIKKDQKQSAHPPPEDKDKHNLPPKSKSSTKMTKNKDKVVQLAQITKSETVVKDMKKRNESVVAKIGGLMADGAAKIFGPK